MKGEIKQREGVIEEWKAKVVDLEVEATLSFKSGSCGFLCQMEKLKDVNWRIAEDLKVSKVNLRDLEEGQEVLVALEPR